VLTTFYNVGGTKKDYTGIVVFNKFRRWVLYSLIDWILFFFFIQTGKRKYWVLELGGGSWVFVVGTDPATDITTKTEQNEKTLQLA
jgi:hypothetical protein